MRLESVNFHLHKRCDSRCDFCFATFRDVTGQLTPDEARCLLDTLRAAGVEKLNFAGGEPTLHPDLGGLLAHARALGFTTSIVTNGARLAALLDQHAGLLDWVGLSADSGDEATQLALGRGHGDHVARTLRHADLLRLAGVKVKLNTVVNALNWREDMGAFVRRVHPARWKVFQALPMRGQNEDAIDPLLIGPAEVAAFTERHAVLAADGFAPVVEDNDAMTGSYAMIDPLGRFFGNNTGAHVYSDPILEVGVGVALDQVGYSRDKYLARGGRYAW